MSEIKRARKWFYALPPAAFEVAPCSCGNADLQWSEFQKHCWCERCQLDFIPAHAGIFDGPVPVKACYALGLNFDRILLPSQERDVYDPETGRYASELRACPASD